MKPSLTNALCTQCGLCCDGSLFADVELAKGEGSALEVLGLEVEDGDDGVRELLLQPCGALKRKRCTIYAHRPECCRSFECRLLQQVKRGEVSMDQARQAVGKALRKIETVKALIGGLAGKDDDERLPLEERFAGVLALSESSGAAGKKLHARRVRLEKEMKSVERLVRRTFLGD